MTISNGTTDSRYIIYYYWSAVTMAYLIMFGFRKLEQRDYNVAKKMFSRYALKNHHTETPHKLIFTYMVDLSFMVYLLLLDIFKIARYVNIKT